MQSIFGEIPKKDLTLDELLEKTKNHTITPEERRLQRISFAYGNASLNNSTITREMVEEADRELHPEDYN